MLGKRRVDDLQLFLDCIVALARAFLQRVGVQNTDLASRDSDKSRGLQLSQDVRQAGTVNS
jgi:hypothetical protein